MASFDSTQYAQAAGMLTSYDPLIPNEQHGRVRVAYAKYSTPASAGPVATDTLNLFKLPQGARVISLCVIVPGSFVTSSAKIGFSSDDDRYGSGKDLSSAGRVEFITAAADADYVTTQEETVYMTFVTANPAASKQIAVICNYVVD